MATENIKFFVREATTAQIVDAHAKHERQIWYDTTLTTFGYFDGTATPVTKYLVTLDDSNNNETTINILTVEELSVSDGDITDVGDISLDSISSAGNDITIAPTRNIINTLGGNAGAETFIVEDSDNVDLFTVDSDGNVDILGNLLMANGSYIQTDKVRARDSDGLLLVDDDNKGIFIKNGGRVGVGTTNPGSLFTVSVNTDNSASDPFADRANWVEIENLNGTVDSFATLIFDVGDGEHAFVTAQKTGANVVKIKLGTRTSTSGYADNFTIDSDAVIEAGIPVGTDYGLNFNGGSEWKIQDPNSVTSYWKVEPQSGTGILYHEGGSDMFGVDGSGDGFVFKNWACSNLTVFSFPGGNQNLKIIPNDSGTDGVIISFSEGVEELFIDGTLEISDDAGDYHDLIAGELHAQADITLANAATVVTLSSDAGGNLTLSDGLILPGELEVTGTALINSSGICEFGTPASNFTKIEVDGTIEFNGDATVWEDINFSLGQLRSGGTRPGFVDKRGTGIYQDSFDVGEEVSGSLEIFHACKLSAAMTPHLHITPDAGDTEGNCKFEMVFKLTVYDGSEWTATTTTIDTGDIAISQAWDTFRADFTTTIDNLAVVGAQLEITIRRIAADTDEWAGEIFVSTWGLHVEKDMVGSRQIAVK